MGERLTPLPWQQGNWEQLQRAKNRRSLPHALLLAGPQGLGKRWFAELLAHSLLCDRSSNQGLPCGQCRGCHLVRAGTHPDLHWVEPEQESKSGEIRIAAIREVSHTEGLTAQAGGYKISIISPADRMNIASANALLKTLEEPPGSALLILISSRIGSLPATIRSRCQVLHFRIPPASLSKEWLAQQVPADRLELLLGLAGGAPLAALTLAGSPWLAERETLLEQFLDIVKDRQDPVAIAEGWVQKDPGQLLLWMSGWLVDMLRLQTNADSPWLFNPDQRNRLGSMAEQLDTPALHRLLQDVCEAAQLASTPLNQQMILEKLLIDWSNLK